MEETKIIYYTDDLKMPYLIKLNMAPDKATLKDFKQSLNANPKNFKYFFQTIVDDFGVVKEELVDDEARLPCVNGRVVSWLIPVEAEPASETVGSKPTNAATTLDSGTNDHFVSMQSISSTGSSVVSNNENVLHRGANQKRPSSSSSSSNKHNQIYDSLNGHHNQQRRSTKNRQLTLK
jgi:hypothetical protein